MKTATLINNQGCIFDTINSNSLSNIKKWAKNRGGIYYLDIKIVNSPDIWWQFVVENNKIYSIK